MNFLQILESLWGLEPQKDLVGPLGLEALVLKLTAGQQ
jgi:hypothetical protein